MGKAVSDLHDCTGAATELDFETDQTVTSRSYGSSQVQQGVQLGFGGDCEKGDETAG